MSAALPFSASCAAMPFFTRLAITCSMHVRTVGRRAAGQQTTDLHLTAASSDNHDTADSVNNETAQGQDAAAAGAFVVTSEAKLVSLRRL
jgi:hypothetical protein